MGHTADNDRMKDGHREHQASSNVYEARELSLTAGRWIASRLTYLALFVLGISLCCSVNTPKASRKSGGFWFVFFQSVGGDRGRLILN